VSELAADAVSVEKDYFCRILEGPPFPVHFTLDRGDRWPSIGLSIKSGESNGINIYTTEPRLKQVLREILEELS